MVTIIYSQSGNKTKGKVVTQNKYFVIFLECSLPFIATCFQFCCVHSQLFCALDDKIYRFEVVPSPTLQQRKKSCVQKPLLLALTAPKPENIPSSNPAQVDSQGPYRGRDVKSAAVLCCQNLRISGIHCKLGYRCPGVVTKPLEQFKWPVG